MSNPHNSIDHHDEAQEEILFPTDAEAGIDFGDDEDHNDGRGSVDDFSDDAEALASAGHGMDEDYYASGGFGDGEE